MPSVHARRWIRGERALRPEDERTLVMESPDEEWMARQHVYLEVVVNRVQALVDAVVDGDHQRVEDITTAVNEALVRLRQEVAERPGKAG